MKRSERARQIKRIDDTFYRLAGCCEHRHEWYRYVELNEQEERAHRIFKPDFVNCGLSKAQSVRLFAVKEIFERFGMPHVCTCGWQGANSTCQKCGKPANAQAIFTPSAEEFFSVRKSIFGAVAMAKICESEIFAEFDRLEMLDWLSDVDYCALNKDPRQAEKVAE